MGLQAILTAIRASGEAQVREIETRAQARAEAVRAEACAEAQRLQQEACTRASIRGSRERTRLLQQARLEAMQLVGSAREFLVDRALQETREQIANVRADSSYPAILRVLTQEALDSLRPSLLGSEQPQLVADRRDCAVLETILREMMLDCPVNYDFNSQGGLIAHSEDGRVMVINTLEARLQRAMPDLRCSLAALFEAAQAEASPVLGEENVNHENVGL